MGQVSRCHTRSLPVLHQQKLWLFLCPGQNLESSRRPKSVLFLTISKPPRVAVKKRKSDPSALKPFPSPTGPLGGAQALVPGPPELTWPNLMASSAFRLQTPSLDTLPKSLSPELPLSRLVQRPLSSRPAPTPHRSACQPLPFPSPRGPHLCSMCPFGWCTIEGRTAQCGVETGSSQ